MINYGHIYGSTKPKEIELTSNLVLVNTNIQTYSKQLDGRTEEGYEYDCICYTKDEYISFLGKTNDELQEQILDTQEALSDLYELIGG